MKKQRYLSVLIVVGLTLILHSPIWAQTGVDSLGGPITLKQAVEYALRNQPAARQASLDEQINERDIKIGLSSWLPQLNSSGLYNYYFKGTPQAGASGANIPSGAGSIRNLSTLGLTASQVLYNNDVLLASKTSKYSRQYYKENTQSVQIDVVSDVSKAFFDVLLSQKQLNITNEDITRLQRSLKDAFNKYQAGVSDKTDYKQATIALNNSIAARKQTEEAIKAKTAYLKQIMGVDGSKPLELSYDSTRYEQEAYIDTNQRLDVNNRIEYRLLQTNKVLRNINVNYYKYGFLPSISAVGSYNAAFFSHDFSNLYDKSYPTGYAGITLSLPIFQGTRRLQNLSKARLQVERIDLDIQNTQNSINTEYVQALASYKSNYTTYQLIRENVDLAKDVYKVVSLQYREGVKTYLDVIIAQSDLRTAELNYYNSLFQLLSSRIDLQRALGTLPVVMQ
ncbi:Outer membrane protein TolC [Mucilaginibacter pineti]|uniref:Outer membrane protein TolC n=1 Tax=Mucilaginibacter pineti TaxID=1391627 RepID=A0A1G7HT73_9SPHI|nr:TolC family protein [Mucilaginibacter pineti]SDF03229.1 Outer membrane protein TolC [Mucilaginibacter pineti]